jgi:hypothetical protein
MDDEKEELSGGVSFGPTTDELLFACARCGHYDPADTFSCSTCGVRCCSGCATSRDDEFLRLYLRDPKRYHWAKYLGNVVICLECDIPFTIAFDD